jgi:hypothetical protein
VEKVLSNTLVGCYCLVARRDTDGSPVLGVFLLVCFVLSQANEGATMFKRMHRTPNAVKFQTHRNQKTAPKTINKAPSVWTFRRTRTATPDVLQARELLRSTAMQPRHRRTLLEAKHEVEAVRPSTTITV